MFSPDDTIVAIATPMGRGGVGIVRLSGPEAPAIAGSLIGRSRALVPRRATFARLTRRRPDDDPTPGSHATALSVRDQVIVTVFPSPQSYTGQDVAEISAHGSPVVLHEIVQAAVAAGARLAEPGEFTLRAFLSGKLDLIQAEAVADLIAAVTPLQARAAFDQLEGTLTGKIAGIENRLFDLMARLEASLDFPDEGYHFVDAEAAIREVRLLQADIEDLLQQSTRGRLIREGAQVAILGTPNVGKSSLFNALLNTNRAIVTAIPGTTRDLLTERVNLRGISVALMDTAGIRESPDVVEQEGVARSHQAAGVADIVVLVLDGSRPLMSDDERLLALTEPRARVVVINKIDLPRRWPADHVAAPAIELSLKTGVGLDQLIDRMAQVLGDDRVDDRDTPSITNQRHITLLQQARGAIGRAGDALAADASISEEFVLADLQDAAARLQEITGRRTTEDLLRHIFERFCIGK